MASETAITFGMVSLSYLKIIKAIDSGRIWTAFYIGTQDEEQPLGHISQGRTNYTLAVTVV